MFILVNEKGVYGYSDLCVRRYDTRDFALYAINNSVSSTFNGEDILHKTFIKKLYAFLVKNEKLLYFPGGTSWNVHRQRSKHISATNFKEFTKRILEHTSSMEGYWLLINMRITSDKVIGCHVAPISALVEKDYANITTVLRNHTIDKILKTI